MRRCPVQEHMLARNTNVTCAKEDQWQLLASCQNSRLQLLGVLLLIYVSVTHIHRKSTTQPPPQVYTDSL